MSDNVRQACEEAAKCIEKLCRNNLALRHPKRETAADIIERHLAPVVSAERAAMREKCAQLVDSVLNALESMWKLDVLDTILLHVISKKIRAIPTEDAPEKENKDENNRNQ